MTTNNKKSKGEKLPPPSDEFMEAICYLSTCTSVECEFCETTYFTTNESNFEEGELEELLKQSGKEPNKYVPVSDEWISWGNLDGKSVVENCPCNLATRYELIFWNNRHVIVNYFKNIAEKIRQQSKAESKLAQSVSDSVVSIDK